MDEKAIEAIIERNKLLEQHFQIIEEKKVKSREYHKIQFAKWKAENPERLKELRSVINKRYNDKKKSEKSAEKALKAQ